MYGATGTKTVASESEANKDSENNPTFNMVY
jgi:hypothetical protein